MIKCADMLSNTNDIVAHDLGFARVYVPEKKLLIDELTKARKAAIRSGAPPMTRLSRQTRWSMQQLNSPRNRAVVSNGP